VLSPLRESFQPIERVPENEIMRRRIKIVRAEILPSPLEVVLRQIHAGRHRAGLRRGHGKRARVGERVKDRLPPQRHRQQSSPILTLVEKYSRRQPLAKIDEKRDVVFADGRSLGQFVPVNQPGDRPFLLGHQLRVNRLRLALGPQSLDQSRAARLRRLRLPLDQKIAVIGIDNHIGETIRLAAD